MTLFIIICVCLVHCRLRKVDSRKHAAPSTSSNTYWQIEKQEDPRSGEYSKNRWKISLMASLTHSLVTILFASHSLSLSLSPSLSLLFFASLSHSFSFLPFLPLGDVIAWRDRCRLKHLPTRCYLAVIKVNSHWKVHIVLTITHSLPSLHYLLPPSLLIR